MVNIELHSIALMKFKTTTKHWFSLVHTIKTIKRAFFTRKKRHNDAKDHNWIFLIVFHHYYPIEHNKLQHSHSHRIFCLYPSHYWTTEVQQNVLKWSPPGKTKSAIKFEYFTKHFIKLHQFQGHHVIIQKINWCMQTIAWFNIWNFQLLLNIVKWYNILFLSRFGRRYSPNSNTHTHLSITWTFMWTFLLRCLIVSDFVRLNWLFNSVEKFSRARQKFE